MPMLHRGQNASYFSIACCNDCGVMTTLNGFLQHGEGEMEVMCLCSDINQCTHAEQSINGAFELFRSLSLGSKDGCNLLEIFAQNVVCK